jgi:hypothetical protein
MLLRAVDMRSWLVACACAAIASGCFHVTTAVVGDERWELLGNEGKQWNAFVAGQPPREGRCAYWRARSDQVHASKRVAVLDALEGASVDASPALRSATVAAEREVCATELRSTFHVRAADRSPP